jgi:hypothetical protein
MTEQEPSILQTAGRAIEVATTWVDAAEGRSRAIVLSAILALPPLLAWAYGVTNVKPASCITTGTRYSPCIMGQASPPFPVNWNGLLLAAFVLAIIVGAVLVLRPQNRNARLVFGAAGAVIAAIAGIQLMMLMGMPNAAQVFAANSAWLVVPGTVGTAAVFAALSSRS